MNPPTLLTRRLSLKPGTIEDFEDMAAIWADPHTVRFIGGQVRDRQDSWFTHLRQRGLWDILGYGYWIVRERRTGEFVGEIGFADWTRGLEPDISGRPEAGWVIAKPFWGQGYCTEAVRAAHDWLDHDNPGRSTCIIEPDNHASIRVAQKVGYRDVCPTEYRGTPVLLLERHTPAT